MRTVMQARRFHRVAWLGAKPPVVNNKKTPATNPLKERLLRFLEVGEEKKFDPHEQTQKIRRGSILFLTSLVLLLCYWAYRDDRGDTERRWKGEFTYLLTIV